MSGCICFFVALHITALIVVRQKNLFALATHVFIVACGCYIIDWLDVIKKLCQYNALIKADDFCNLVHEI